MYLDDAKLRENGEISKKLATFAWKKDEKGMNFFGKKADNRHDTSLRHSTEQGVCLTEELNTHLQNKDNPQAQENSKRPTSDGSHKAYHLWHSRLLSHPFYSILAYANFQSAKSL